MGGIEIRNYDSGLFNPLTVERVGVPDTVLGCRLSLTVERVGVPDCESGEPFSLTIERVGVRIPFSLTVERFTVAGSLLNGLAFRLAVVTRL